MSSVKLQEWTQVRNTIYTPEEIVESDMRVKFMKELMKLRDSKKISQADFNILIEGDDTIKDIDDMLDFIFHMLEPLGKTISIVDKVDKQTAD